MKRKEGTGQLICMCISFMMWALWLMKYHEGLMLTYILVSLKQLKIYLLEGTLGNLDIIKDFPSLGNLD